METWDFIKKQRKSISCSLSFFIKQKWINPLFEERRANISGVLFVEKEFDITLYSFDVSDCCFTLNREQSREHVYVIHTTLNQLGSTGGEPIKTFK